MHGLIIFLGEAFRKGGQYTRNIGSDESYVEQMEGCASHIEFINYLQETHNCAISTYLGTYSTKYDDHLTNFYKDYSIGQTFYTERIGYHRLLHESVSQIQMIDKYDFVLFIRIDLFLKPHFLKIFDPAWSTIRFTSSCAIQLCRSNNQCPRVNDVMLFMPKKYYKYIKYIDYDDETKSGHRMWLYFIERTDLRYKDLDMMIDTFHDSDTAKDCNDVYYIVNRGRSVIYHSVGAVFNKYHFYKYFPRKLHLTCKDAAAISKYASCIEKFKGLYGDCEIKIYYDDDIYEIIKTHYPDDYEFLKTVSGVLLADTFRYLMLYLEGGFFSDMDVVPLKPIAGLFNELHYHGNSENRFFIYPEGAPLVTAQWDHYTNPCPRCTFVMKTGITTYSCNGHRYVDEDTNIVVCKENFQIGPEYKTPHNDARLCKWFIAAKPKQELFLNCYMECVKNLRANYSTIIALRDDPATNKEERKMQYWLNILKNTGSIFFTKMVNGYLPNAGVTILPSDFFCMGSGSGTVTPRTKNSYIKHLYNGSYNKW